MSDDRVIQYLRTRGRAEPEPELVARIMAAVDEAPSVRTPFAVFVPAAAIAGAVALVIALAIFLGQSPNVGPDPSDATVPSPSPASVEELRGALESAWAVLREAPGVDGVATSSILGELSGATWFSWRPNGDQVVIFRSDLDVAESGWWSQPEGRPRARGVNVTSTIHVLVGDQYFMTDGDAWVVQARADAPPAFTIPTGMLDDEPSMSAMAVGNAGDEVTVASDPGGGTTWTLVSPYRDGRVISEWQIGPDGGMVSESYELVDVTETLDFHPLASSGRTEFKLVRDAGPIEAPDSAVPPDPDALGLPTDFPLGDGHGEPDAALPITNLDVEPKPGIVEDWLGPAAGPVIQVASGVVSGQEFTVTVYRSAERDGICMWLSTAEQGSGGCGAVPGEGLPEFGRFGSMGQRELTNGTIEIDGMVALDVERVWVVTDDGRRANALLVPFRLDDLEASVFLVVLPAGAQPSTLVSADGSGAVLDEIPMEPVEPAEPVEGAPPTPGG